MNVEHLYSEYAKMTASDLAGKEKAEILSIAEFV